MADKGLEDIEQSQIESNYDETVDSFDEMNLKPELLRGKIIPLPHMITWEKSSLEDAN